MFSRFTRPRAFALALGLVTQAACAREAAPPRSVLVDDFGDTLAIGAVPLRIVSLNPTTTELVYAIGAGTRMVGRTTWDSRPAEVLNVTDVGPGLRPNVEAVLAVRPDLVLLYASADNRDAARRLRTAGVATASWKIDRIADMMRVTAVLGRLVGDTAAASRTVDSVSATLQRIRTKTAGLPRPRVFWPLWDAPLLSVGGGSWLNELLEIAGATNVFGEMSQPSPSVAFEELLRRDPDIILVGPTNREKYLRTARWRTLRAARENRMLVIDTSIINGPSARVGAGAESLARLLHPTVSF